MSLSGGKRTIAGVIGALALWAGGCVSHDQVYIGNPSPVRVRCHPDHVAPLNPECHGYHPTCWVPWSSNCPACPPPAEGVGVPYPAHFEMFPEEVPVHAEPIETPNVAPAPDLPPEMNEMPEPEPAPLEPDPSFSPTGGVQEFELNDEVDAPPAPNGDIPSDGGDEAPELPDYFE